MERTQKIILVGRTGVGKSTLANVLLHGPQWDYINVDRFEVGRRVLQPQTTRCETKHSRLLDLLIVDTPGLDDPDLRVRAHRLEEITQCMAASNCIVLIVVTPCTSCFKDTAEIALAIRQFMPEPLFASSVGLIVNQASLQCDEDGNLRGYSDESLMEFNKLLNLAEPEHGVSVAACMTVPDSIRSGEENLRRSVHAMLTLLSPIPAGVTRTYRQLMDEAVIAEPSSRHSPEVAREAVLHRIKEFALAWKHNVIWFATARCDLTHQNIDNALPSWLPAVYTLGSLARSENCYERLEQMLQYDSRSISAGSRLKCLRAIAHDPDRCELEACYRVRHVRSLMTPRQPKNIGVWVAF